MALEHTSVDVRSTVVLHTGRTKKIAQFNKYPPNSQGSNPSHDISFLKHPFFNDFYDF